MTTIKSLYIPHVEKHFNAEFIADIFSKNGLAQVSKIYLKPNYRHNRAYIEIASWNETEAAYSFIKRLRNPSTEARLVYSDDNWWTVNINKNPSIFTSKKRVLTVFTKPNELDEEDETFSTTAVGNMDDYDLDSFVKIDPEKTKLLRDIIAKLKENQEKERMQQEEVDATEYEAYLRQIDWARNSMCREVTCDM